jgi:hypothetical protein
MIGLVPAKGFSLKPRAARLPECGDFAMCAEEPASHRRFASFNDHSDCKNARKGLRSNVG